MSAITEIVSAMRKYPKQKFTGEELLKHCPTLDKQTLYSTLSHWSRKSTPVLLLRAKGEGDGAQYVYWLNTEVKVPPVIEDDLLRMAQRDAERTEERHIPTVAHDLRLPPRDEPKVLTTTGNGTRVDMRPPPAPPQRPTEPVARSPYDVVIEDLKRRRAALLAQLDRVDVALDAVRGVRTGNR